MTQEQFINDVVDDWFRDTNRPFMVDQECMGRIVKDVMLKLALTKVTLEIKETAFNLLCAQVDEMGIYPKEFVGHYEKRTEKMEGWNKALIEIIGRLALVETSKEEGTHP
jgi:hypothetical protein